MIPKVPVTGSAADLFRKLGNTINAILDGRQNNVGSFTLADGATTTAVTDFRVGSDSVITLMPTTATAALAMTAVYVSAIDPLTNTFTLTHDNTADTDRTFKYEVTG